MGDERLMLARLLSDGPDAVSDADRSLLADLARVLLANPLDDESRFPRRGICGTFCPTFHLFGRLAVPYPSREFGHEDLVRRFLWVIAHVRVAVWAEAEEGSALERRPNTIRSQPSDGAAGADRAGRDGLGPRPNTPLMLDGHCPVTLAERHHWQQGDPRIDAIHEGRSYLFVTQDEQRRFLESPGRYAPRLCQENVNPLPPLVGDLGDAKHWEIRGAESFTAANVAKALANHIEVACVARSGQPLDVFLKVLAEEARLGYQSHGFPDVRVQAFVDQRTT
jgi:hypothetical protein